MELALSGSMIFVLVLAVLVLMTLWLGVVIVPQGYEYTIERFGRFRQTLTPGLNLIVPYVDRVRFKVNVQETVLDIPSQLVITRDNATVTVDGVAFYQIVVAEQAAYQVANLRDAIVNLSLTNIRTAIGSMELDEVLSRRDEINTRLLSILDSATRPWGTKITRVELKDVRPPDDVVAAMSKQLTADRQKRAQVLEAEGFRQSEILKAEGEKQSQILAAEGRLEAAKRDAEARERLAEAEAKATEVVAAAAANGGTQALNYFVAQRYVQALTDIGSAPNTKLVMLPLEAAGIAGSIAGIVELVRDASGTASAAKVASPPRPWGEPT
jgi:regulator of protease activity HflC (stomatin/prohibitin superfamily)